MPHHTKNRWRDSDQINGYRTPYNRSQGRRRSQKKYHRNAKRDNRPNRRWGNNLSITPWGSNVSSWGNSTRENRTPVDRTPVDRTPVDRIGLNIPFETHGPGNTPPYMGSPKPPYSPKYMGSPRLEYAPASPAYDPTRCNSKMPPLKTFEKWNEKMIDNKDRSVLDKNEFRKVWKLHVATNGVIDETTGPVQDRNWEEDTEMSESQYNFLRDRCANKIVEKEKDDLCSICLVAKRTHIYSDCGHFCVCEECVNTLEGRSDYNCPICRRTTSRFQKVYC